MMKRRIYILGEGKKYLNQAKCDWPYGLDYEPANESKPFILWEGVGHGAGAASFAAQSLLDGNWDSHIKYACCEWLVPLLREITAGEQVSESEIFSAYEAEYGKPPKLRE